MGINPKTLLDVSGLAKSWEIFMRALNLSTDSKGLSISMLPDIDARPDVEPETFWFLMEYWYSLFRTDWNRKKK